MSQTALVSISIHAPAGGATTAFLPVLTDLLFQSTLPRGERLLLLLDRPMQTKISIHAPAGGATCIDAIAAGSLEFQSTLPRGERPGYAVDLFTDFLFQSTLPRGERP